MTSRVRMLVALAAAVVGSAGGAAQASAGVFWTNDAPFGRSNGSVGAAHLDGSHKDQTFIKDALPGVTTSNLNIAGIAVDGDYVYWTDAMGPHGSIGRAQIVSGHAHQIRTQFLTLAYTGGDEPYSVVVAGNYIYWSNYGDSIGRAQVSGARPAGAHPAPGVAPRFITRAGEAIGALAVQGNHLYWLHQTGYGPAQIEGALLNGSAAPSQFTPVLNTRSPAASGLAVDGNYFYWSNGTTDLIGREEVVGGELFGFKKDFIRLDGDGGPLSVATEGRYIYWTDQPGRQPTIGRAKLNGSNPASHVNSHFITGLYGYGATNAVAVGAAPVDLSPPIVSGRSLEGDVLSEGHGLWSGNPANYRLRWERCDSSGKHCKAITEATKQSYKLAAADLGQTLRVTETANNLWGSSSAMSSATSVVLPPAPVSLSPPTVSVTVSQPVEQGTTLTEMHGSWTNGPTAFTYQWEDCFPSGQGCVAIGGATEQSYTLQASDVGDTIVVQETASNAGGKAGPVSSAPTPVVIPAPPTNSSPPSIAGDLTQGQTLTDVPAAWSNNPTSFTYQWEDCDPSGQNCVANAGATGPSYTLGASDVGKTILVQESATNGGGTGGPVASPATGVVRDGRSFALPVNSLPPVISSPVVAGETVSASSGAWEGTPNATTQPPTLGYAYQWRLCQSSSLCQDISGATSATYFVPYADASKVIDVEVTASNNGGSAQGYSAEAVIAGPPGTPARP